MNEKKIIDEDLLKTLVCSFCKSEVQLKQDKLVCTNRHCRREYSIDDGIPIMLSSQTKDSREERFKKTTTEFFNKWTQQTTNKFSSVPTPFDKFFGSNINKRKIRYSEDAIIELITKTSGPLALDLGCGAGEHTTLAAGVREQIHIISIDISLSSVKITRQKLLSNSNSKAKVSFVLCDAERLPFRPKVFSAVIAVMFLHHVFNVRKVLVEISRVLKGKGYGLIIEITSDNPLMRFCRRIFSLMPRYVKKRMRKDYITSDGDIPSITHFKARELKKYILTANLRIIKEGRYGLFLFAFHFISKVFPMAKCLFSEAFLLRLYRLEQKLLGIRPFKKFGGVILVWITPEE